MFTSVLEEDASWAPQYLAECERLQTPFVIHLDRCGAATKRLFAAHRLCAGSTEQNDPEVEFNEQYKQAPFDLVVRLGFAWAWASDVDETYERDAPHKLEEIQRLDADLVDVRWVNLWGDTRHVRVDGTFGAGHRVKFYNLRTRRWVFDHKITNGAKAADEQGVALKYKSYEEVRRGPGSAPVLAAHDLVCLHHGMMTRELRLLHKERWDRIYTAAVGDNPYGFWRYALDEEAHPPVVAPHDYF